MNTPLRAGQEDAGFRLHLAHVQASAQARRRPVADCPFCGKAEGDACPSCGGVNATEGANKKRRARELSERAGDGRRAPSPTVTEATATGKPAPRGDL